MESLKRISKVHTFCGHVLFSIYHKGKCFRYSLKGHSDSQLAKRSILETKQDLPNGLLNRYQRCQY